MAHTKRTLTIMLILVMALMPACITASAYFGKITPPKVAELLYINAGEPRSIDPHKTAGIPEQNIINSLIEPLTIYDPKTLAPIPGVAERWESKDNATRWIFYLRKNSRWTDGKPVRAQDFVWAWQRAVTPATATPYVALMYYVKNGEAIANKKLPPTELGVKALDDYTLEVQMEKPTAFFVKMTPHYVFAPLPQWTLEQWGDKWTTAEHYVGNGAFKLLEHKPYSRVVVVKNPSYWDAANVKLERVVFLPIADASTSINLYKAGEATVLQSGSIPISFIKTLRNNKDYVSGAYFTTYYFSLNVKKKPFDNKLVRKALNMAVDKRAITDKLIGKGDIPATTFVPPGIAGYPVLTGDSYNVEKAKQLLAEAGYPNGQGFPKTTIYFNTLETHRQIAEAIQRMWKEALNIDIELQNEEWQTFTARRERRDFDLARDSWTGDYLDANTFLDIFVTDAPNNHSGWTDPEYTKLIETANSEPDEAKRNELLAKAEGKLLEEMPFIPVYYYALSYLQKPFIEGWYANLSDLHPLKFVSIRQDWQPETPPATK